MFLKHSHVLNIIEKFYKMTKPIIAVISEVYVRIMVSLIMSLRFYVRIDDDA